MAKKRRVGAQEKARRQIMRAYYTQRIRPAKKREKPGAKANQDFAAHARRRLGLAEDLQEQAGNVRPTREVT